MVALSRNFAASAMPLLRERLLPETDSVHLPVLLLWTGRLLRQAAAMRQTILLFPVRRLLP